jgi:hypothetical protein
MDRSLVRARLFVDRVRAFGAQVLGFWADENSGAAGTWVERVRLAKDAVAAIISRGENRRAVAGLGRELGEEIAHDLTAAAQAPTPDPRQDPKSGRAWGEMEQKRQQERGREPDDKAPERPEGADFDAIGAAYQAGLWESPEQREDAAGGDLPEAEPQRPESPPAPEPEPEPDQGPDMG